LWVGGWGAGPRPPTPNPPTPNPQSPIPNLLKLIIEKKFEN